MRLTLVAGLISLILAILPESAVAQASAGDPRAAFERFVAAFNALDWVAFRDCFADTATLFNPDIPDAVSLHRLDGRAEIEQSFRAVFNAANGHGPSIRPENVRIQQFSDTAIVTFEFSRPQHSFGRRTIVFNRQGAQWLIVHIHASNVVSSVEAGH
jgi:ketosteroid isomerase-like protein